MPSGWNISARNDHIILSLDYESHALLVAKENTVDRELSGFDTEALQIAMCMVYFFLKGQQGLR
jgi:hypothetical protein